MPYAQVKLLIVTIPYTSNHI